MQGGLEEAGMVTSSTVRSLPAVCILNLFGGGSGVGGWGGSSQIIEFSGTMLVVSRDSSDRIESILKVSHGPTKYLVS
jgi:hypothetical protein